MQGVYVSDKEVEAIVDFLKAQAAPEYLEEATAVQEDFGEAVVDDELLPEAARLLIENGQASISMLQRRLRIDSIAARLMDQMEARGIVGSFEGASPARFSSVGKNTGRCSVSSFLIAESSFG